MSASRPMDRDRGSWRLAEGAEGDWCPRRSSKLRSPARTRVGGFDSHTFPPVAWWLRRRGPSVRDCHPERKVDAA